MCPQEIIFIVGPTAVGKTDIAFRLAQHLNSEIVSCDSMQVYSQISIVNNKPPPEMLKAVPHHLIDIVSVSEEFDVAFFYRLAEEAIKKIHAKNKIPVVVAGSGMYMQILLDGIFEGGAKNVSVRHALERRVKVEGNERLYAELRTVDARAASKIHPNDTRRVIRALEVCQTTQRPLSELQPLRRGIWGKYDISINAFNRPRAKLYDGINQRVDQMFDSGLVEEIKNLNDVTLSRTAHKVIGVEEVRGYLNGEYDLQQAKYLMKLRTRHLAKRQLTWFRKDKRLQWFNIAEDESLDAFVAKIFPERE